MPGTTNSVHKHTACKYSELLGAQRKDLYLTEEIWPAGNEFGKQLWLLIFKELSHLDKSNQKFLGLHYCGLGFFPLPRIREHLQHYLRGNILIKSLTYAMFWERSQGTRSGTRNIPCLSDSQLLFSVLGNIVNKKTLKNVINFSHSYSYRLRNLSLCSQYHLKDLLALGTAVIRGCTIHVHYLEMSTLPLVGWRHPWLQPWLHELSAKQIGCLSPFFLIMLLNLHASSQLIRTFCDK